ncbi:hypothetical protein MRB53_030256 [Persea americana]|uniref:Uncharacterized protein n=1 Tax=Persea americana TaxID=3435 RepID=A0ACC2KL22_PERAE|nr:hypothetical protein MRB53_030256 [Persea americana]
MLWVLLLLLVFHCNASKHDCFSSCGSLNITYPFRLKQDPKTCGRPETEFELTCESESNRLVANLSSRPFYIKEISYKRGTIRAIDSVLSSNDCSSLPSFPGERDLGPFYVFNSNSIVFVNCSLPVDNPHYISTAPCISGPPGMYVYAMMGDRTLLDVNTSCKVAMKVSGLVVGGSGISYPPSNYSGIHGILMMGSELNWRYLKCEDMVDCWGEYRMCDWVTFLSQMRRCTSCGRLFQSSYCFIETVKLYLEVSNFASLNLLAVAAYYTFYKKNITIGRANFSGYIEIYFLARTTIGLVCLFIFLAYKLRRRHIWMDTTVEDFLSHYRSHMPRSFGMLLMEIVGRRQKIDAFTEQSSHTYFPSWIYNELDQGGDMVMEGITGVDKEIVRKLIVAALWCTQIKPKDRPSMSKVLEMLEGSVEDLQLPPKSSLSFPQEIDSKEHASSADRLLPDQDWSHKALLSHIE